jgi:hypothetical protein
MLLQVFDSPETTGIGIIQPDETKTYIKKKENAQGFLMDKLTKLPTPPFNMLGNVWEWVEDDWHENYNGAPIDGHAWIDEARGSNRVVRGNSWIGDAQYCLSAIRSINSPDFRNFNLGFRLSRSLP